MRYDRIIGFVRHNQAMMDNNARIAAMYAELRAAPKAQEAFEQKVERVSLFERYVLERWPKDDYCDQCSIHRFQSSINRFRCAGG